MIAVYGWPLTSNACGGAESDGNCWLALQQEQKLAFVIGFDTGTEFYDTARSLDDPFVSPYFDRPRHFLRDVTFGEIVTFLDEFYSNSWNKKVILSNAILISTVHFADDDANDELALTLWFRSSPVLPKLGNIVSVVSADLLVLDTAAGLVKFKLAAVTTNGASEKQQRSASTWLSQLRYALSGQDCSDSTYNELAIAYEEDFFYAPDIMTGYLYPANDNVALCPEGERVASRPGGLPPPSINDLLLRKGLLAPEPPTDPKWSFWKTSDRILRLHAHAHERYSDRLPPVPLLEER